MGYYCGCRLKPVSGHGHVSGTWLCGVGVILGVFGSGISCDKLRLFRRNGVVYLFDKVVDGSFDVVCRVTRCLCNLVGGKSPDVAGDNFLPSGVEALHLVFQLRHRDSGVFLILA